MLPLKVPYVNINGSLSNAKPYIDQAKGCMEFLFTQGTKSLEFQRAVRDFYESEEGKACGTQLITSKKLKYIFRKFFGVCDSVCAASDKETRESMLNEFVHKFHVSNLSASNSFQQIPLNEYYS